MAIDLESLLKSGVAWRAVRAPKLELPLPRGLWKLSKQLSRRQAVVGVWALHGLVVVAAIVGLLTVSSAIAMIAFGWLNYGLRTLRPKTGLATATELSAEGIAVTAGHSVTVVPWDQVDAQGDVKVEWGFTNLVVVRTKTQYAFGRVFVLRREVAFT